MHIYQAICQPDASEFIKAMIIEIDTYVDKKNWVLIKRCIVQEIVDIIQAVKLMESVKAKFDYVYWLALGKT